MWPAWWVVVAGVVAPDAACPDDVVKPEKSGLVEALRADSDRSRADMCTACISAPADASDLGTVICFDYVDDDPRRVSTRFETQNDLIVLPPNGQTVIRVIRRRDASVDIALGGVPGETEIRIDGKVVAGPSSATVSSPTRAYHVKGFTIYEARFVPRTTGYAPITLSPREDEKHVIEMLVPNLYAGAVRVGIAGIGFLDEHGYERRGATAAQPGTVLDGGARAVSLELVVGYAAYWEGFTQRRGRDYVRKWKTFAAPRFAPYVALGITGLSHSGNETRARWLRSFYVGLEWEPVANVSLAVGLALSRVDTLADGLRVGGPVGADDRLVDTEVRPGLFFALNLSPELFKLGAGFK